jgi:hypothetical protein
MLRGGLVEESINELEHILDSGDEDTWEDTLEEINRVASDLSVEVEELWDNDVDEQPAPNTRKVNMASIEKQGFWTTDTLSNTLKALC